MKKAKPVKRGRWRYRNQQEVPIGCSGTRIVNHLISASSLRSLIATNKDLWEEG